MAAEVAIGATGLATSGATATELSGAVSGAKGLNGSSRSSLPDAFSKLGLDTGASAGSASTTGIASFRENWQKILAQMSKTTELAAGTTETTDAASQIEDALSLTATQTSEALKSTQTTETQQTGSETQPVASVSSPSELSTEQGAILAAMLASGGQSSVVVAGHTSAGKDSLDTMRDDEHRGNKGTAKQKSTLGTDSETTAQAGASQLSSVDGSVTGTLSVPSLAANVSTPQSALSESGEDTGAEASISGGSLNTSAVGMDSARDRWSGLAGVSDTSAIHGSASAASGSVKRGETGIALPETGSTTQASSAGTFSLGANTTTAEASASQSSSAAKPAWIESSENTSQGPVTGAQTSGSGSSLSGMETVSNQAGSDELSSTEPVVTVAAPTQIAPVDSSARSQATSTFAHTSTPPASNGQPKSMTTVSETGAAEISTPTTDSRLSSSPIAIHSETGSARSCETAATSNPAGGSAGTQNPSANAASDPTASSVAAAQVSTEKSASAATSGSSKATSSERKSAAIATGTAAKSTDRSAATSGMTSILATGDGLHVTTSGREVTDTGSKTAAISASDAFASMDSAELPGKGVWVHAGSRAAEAGYQDPTLGWVGVRADLSGGSVHAMLVAGSASAADSLTSQVAGLHGYLAEQHSSVSTVTVASPDGGQAGLDFSQGMGAGSGGQSGQGQTAGSSDGLSSILTESQTGFSRQQTATTLSDVVSLSALGTDGYSVGRNLSVMA